MNVSVLMNRWAYDCFTDFSEAPTTLFLRIPRPQIARKFKYIWSSASCICIYVKATVAGRAQDNRPDALWRPIGLAQGGNQNKQTTEGPLRRRTIQSTLRGDWSAKAASPAEDKTIIISSR
jgi:hypothetical protein